MQTLGTYGNVEVLEKIETLPEISRPVKRFVPSTFPAKHHFHF